MGREQTLPHLSFINVFLNCNIWSILLRTRRLVLWRGQNLGYYTAGFIDSRPMVSCLTPEAQLLPLIIRPSHSWCYSRPAAAKIAQLGHRNECTRWTRGYRTFFFKIGFAPRSNFENDLHLNFLSNFFLASAIWGWDQSAASQLSLDYRAKERSG